MGRPSCGSCTAQKRKCIYKIEPPRKRPTTAVINALQGKERRLKQLILSLKDAPPEEVCKILNGISFENGCEEFPMLIPSPPAKSTRTPETAQSSLPTQSAAEHDNFNAQQAGVLPYEAPASDEILDASPFQSMNHINYQSRTPEAAQPALSAQSAMEHADFNTQPAGVLPYEAPASDENLAASPFHSMNHIGHQRSFGPSSALQALPHPPVATESVPMEHIRNRLITNGVLERQREHELRYLNDIDGVPVDLAIHLLDLHWTRQHHTFLLTYRPAIMRDLREGGPHCSPFLINAIFATSSKFSRRKEVCDAFGDPSTAGARFFERCDELLFNKDSLLITPSVPTVVGLLLLGSTFIARGEISKGWLYSGYALRMTYDLGLHLDLKVTLDNAEELEIRRRVFWGAFVCDKLQSLYLGRPIAIHLGDAHVPPHFMDSLEEKELWRPYADPMFPEISVDADFACPVASLSVSTFQQLCSLSQIMAEIINKFYIVGATAARALESLPTIVESLDAWKRDLPPQLIYDPALALNTLTPPPNVLHLHGIYNSLIILLYRPLLSDGHLRTAATPSSSWKRCTQAAWNITNLALAYQSTYSFRGGPYLLAYALYVACTIHVRNAAAFELNQHGENSALLTTSLNCLDELTIPNTGVLRPTSIIRNLISKSNLHLEIDMTRERRQPDWGVEVDAILRMFPDRSLDPVNFPQSSGFEHALNEDVLYGFMDVR
jgi:hypothetical protein